MAKLYSMAPAIGESISGDESMYSTATSVPLETSRSLSDRDTRRNWFALYTRTHHEKRVVEHLKQRGIENYLPLYKAVHTWTHYRKVTLDLPLFPNYLFVHIAPQERVRTLEAPGALSFAGNASAPAPLPESEIESLRSALQLRKFEPHRYLTAGTRAHIVAGPLAGMEGIVVRTKSSLRVVLTVDLILQSVAVEVDASELEPCGPNSHG
jgi:transcription antitermination factor NusG